LLVILLPPDAIEEFNLITNNASAEFGNFMGGIVTPQSSPVPTATTAMFGEFFRNDKLNANSWSNNFQRWWSSTQGQVALEYVWRYLGGPIFKNKLFFFVDYQGQRFDISELLRHKKRLYDRRTYRGL